MALKCLVLSVGLLSPTHSYKEIDLHSPKGGKVLYGGEKRKNNSIENYGKLESLQRSVSSLMRKFDITNSGSKRYEIYLLGDKAVLPFLLLQYHSEYVGSFMFDDLVADKLDHINWSIDHLDREMSMLINKFNTLGFFKEKHISDTKLEDAFPAYIKALEVFSEEIHRRRELLIDEAEEIIKAGW